MNVSAVAKLGVLREANFRRYFLGQGLSMFGDTLVPLALAFAVLNLTGFRGCARLVLLASRVPMTVLTLLGGSVGDHFPRRRVMIAADLIRMLAHAFTATLLVTGEAKLWQLVVLQFVAGSAAAFFEPAASGLVSDIVTKEKVTEANALIGLSRSSIALLGISASGTIFATVGPGWAFALNALSFGANAFFLVRLRLPVGAVITARPGFLSHIAEGFAYVRGQRWLVATIAYTSLLNALAIAPLMVLGPTVAKQHLGGAASWAVVLLGSAFGAIAGSTASLRDRFLASLRWVASDRSRFCSPVSTRPFTCMGLGGVRCRLRSFYM